MPDVAAPRLGPDGRPDLRYLQLHENFLARGRQGPIGVLFIGDSITEGWNFVPEVWNAYYAAHAAANFGIAGDQTQHVLWRIEHGELDGIRPKLVVLMIGTNNIDRKPVDMAKGVKKVVGEVRRKLPFTKLLLLGIFPRGADPKEKQAAAFRFKIKSVNAVLAGLDDGRMLRYLDIGPKFLDAQGRIPAELMPDALHPNAAGYRVWAEAMQPLFHEMMK